MKFFSLTFVAAVLTGLSIVDARPAASNHWSAVHGHKMRPKANNGTAFPTTTPTASPTAKSLLALNAAPFSANGPKFVTYIDNTSGSTTPAAFAVPGSVPNNDYNVIILGFWLDSGLYDSGYSWAQLDSATRQSYLDQIHAAGKKILISAFGAAEWPTSGGVDPTKSANNLAAIVKQYGFDGADIDWEDNNAMDAGTGEAWLITFQQALRAQLPEGQYLISHAPQAPYFIVNKSLYPNGAYQAVHAKVGSTIDWYNTQFYNQGSSGYDTCTTLLHTSGGAFPGTSLFEIIGSGVTSNKLLIGKPATPAGATNTGYMAPGDLATCISQANAAGWDAGVMLWQFTLDTSGAIINQLASAMSSTGGSTGGSSSTTTTVATTTTTATSTPTSSATTTKATTTTASASSTPTGLPTCASSNNGAMTCVSSGTNAAYQECVNGGWISASCQTGTVCIQNGAAIYCGYPTK